MTPAFVGSNPTSPARGITSKYDVGSYLLSGSKAERRCLNDVSMPDTRVQLPQIALVMKKIIFKMSIGRIAQTILVKVLKNRVGGEVGKMPITRTQKKSPPCILYADRETNYLYKMNNKKMRTPADTIPHDSTHVKNCA